MLKGPVIAAWMLGALTALGLAGSIYRTPIQVSDSLEVIERVSGLPSLGAAFVDGLHNSPVMLRPLKQVETKLLVEAGEALGNRYHLVFRGYHAAAGAALIALFLLVCRVRTWTDVAALGFGLAVLTGMQTFVGLFREAFPLNHFLLVALAVLATYALAQTRGGRLVDLAAAAIFAVAALTFETGLLVWPVAVTGYVAGLRGISKRGIALMTIVLIAYGTARVTYLQYRSIGVGQRTTGFGTGTLSPQDQVTRFGEDPTPFYAYNAAMSATSVLVSQPTVGQWTVVNAWRQGRLPPVYVVQIGSSLLTSALIAWFMIGRGASGSRRWRDPISLVFLVLLVANAIMSYSYAKEEVVSAAGVLYAVMACVAARALLAHRPPVWLAGPIIAVALAVSSAWAIRSIGLHLKLRHGAFDARSQWASVFYPTNPASWPAEGHTRQIVERMREEALMQRTIAPAMLPRWTEQWWGED